jgi:hypothetical protein
MRKLYPILCRPRHWASLLESPDAGRAQQRAAGPVSESAAVKRRHAAALAAVLVMQQHWPWAVKAMLMSVILAQLLGA